MKSVVIVRYYDPDTTQSVRIAAKAYSLEIIDITENSERANEALVTVKGEIEDVERFREDVEEGDIDPFESKRDMSDLEYARWLQAELLAVGYDWKPDFSNYEDEPETEEAV